LSGCQLQKPGNLTFSTAAGEDRQVPGLTIFTPQKPRNHAKNAKIVKIVNVLH
jgi:hypothetical protein